MPVFSPKARRMIDLAVSNLPDACQRQIWESWSRSHTESLTSSSLSIDSREIPKEVAAVAVGALERLASDFRRSAAQCADDEDALSDLHTDIAFIKGIESLLMKSLYTPHPTARAA